VYKWIIQDQYFIIVYKWIMQDQYFIIVYKLENIGPILNHCVQVTCRK